MTEPYRAVTVEPVKPINPSWGPDPVAFENNVIPCSSCTQISDPWDSYGMATLTRRAALYVRVSTSDRGQAVENQLQPLQEAAGRLGWSIVAVFRDEGVSGTSGRDKRPGLDALLKGVGRREFDIVAAWSVCRLGRSLSDLIGLLGELRSRDIDLYLHQQALDTSTPSARMLFGMLSVFSEFERAMTYDRVMAGLDSRSVIWQAPGPTEDDAIPDRSHTTCPGREAWCARAGATTKGQRRKGVRNQAHVSDHGWSASLIRRHAISWDENTYKEVNPSHTTTDPTRRWSRNWGCAWSGSFAISGMDVPAGDAVCLAPEQRCDRRLVVAEIGAGHPQRRAVVAPDRFQRGSV